ncbi:hypothetical protein QY97_02466 [Bacillus thermotolerans]|uniref:Uncharacterized protein n=1 Tax=Bacillus thermotolerans TaxID=1221996 RepID=A0A0F5HM99_BACTR|nr:hypothetical protein QY96_00614 [Bacillus thermotolerans]KKB34393.1 hypothetical protein QY97_02466 [Bacillus thermotolerans]KKB38350.1 hypothetical protein QY95_02598 [Bacillus thermotolerans]
MFHWIYDHVINTTFFVFAAIFLAPALMMGIIWLLPEPDSKKDKR